MLKLIRQSCRDLLIRPSCPICSAEIVSHPREQHPCQACCQALGLGAHPCHGRDPLPWIAAGLYQGRLREKLLQLRSSGNLRQLRALSAGLRERLPAEALLVPIPSWKHRSRANPLPALICQSLERSTREFLERTSAGMGQHHLRARQRLDNQRSAFKATALATEVATNTKAIGAADRMPPLWIVDDILTTGATALAAMTALQTAGLTVHGLICLARTPRKLPRSGTS